MKGIELSKKFYYECFHNILQTEFKDLLPYLCVGLVGSGSVCLNLDDEISQDHDFEPNFCIFVPTDKIDRKRLFALEKAYYRLPKVYLGYQRCEVIPGDVNRYGVIDIHQFYEAYLGDYQEINFMHVSSHNLLCVTNGEIFYDNYHEFTKIRNSLLKYPLNVKLKKLSSNLLMMSQSGLYNYPRMIKRNDSGASLALHEYLKHLIEVLYLLEDSYKPFYKWQIRILQVHHLHQNIVNELIKLLNHAYNNDETQIIINKINIEVIDEICKTYHLNSQNIEEVAFKLNDLINDASIKLLDVYESL